MPRYIKLNPELIGRDTKQLQDYLTRNVIGQAEAVRETLDIISVAQAGLNDLNKPAGVFLFLGPTGVGKTHLVEKLSEKIHGGTQAMNLIKLNGGEFAADHEVAKLLGAPPGYLGHKETAPLITQQKINSLRSSNFPFTFILIDEVEKASPSLQKVLLNIFDRGKLTLGTGEVVTFTQCIFFLTSNLGAKELNRLVTSGLGLAPSTISTSAAHQGAIGASKKHFSPEFFNRLDKTITFRHLEKSDLLKILTLELAKVELRAEGRFYLKVSPAAHEWLALKGYDKEYGARHLRRAVLQYITLPISRFFNSEQFTKHSDIHIELRGEELVYKVEEAFSTARSYA